MRRETILDAVERYYSAKFDEHGARAEGVDWNSAESQELRFEQLAHLFRGRTDAFSVNDLGCGYGAFASFLRRRSYEARYVGYELSAAMLDWEWLEASPMARVRALLEPGARCAT